MSRLNHEGEIMAEAKETKSKTKKAKEARESEIIAEAVIATEDTPDIEIELVSEEPKIEAKAGKRSPKAIKEAEEKKAKQARKTADDDTHQTHKTAKKPTRSKAERAGKKYREAHKLIDRDKTYPMNEAMELAVKTSPTKFDATVELHINLGVDPRQADQNVRDMVILPAGTGKTVRVAVMAEDEDAVKAKAAGADIVGSDELLTQLDKEQIEFDVLISTPTLMARLGKYAKLLGPRGLMPNPKSGTVATDVATAVKQARAGRVEFRVDQAGIIHLAIGKISFGANKLVDNADAVTAGVKAAKPASLKGVYVKSAYVSTTMGPSVRLTI